MQMRRAGLAILFGFSIYVSCISVVALAKDLTVNWLHVAVLVLIALCHSTVGYQQLGEGHASLDESSAMRLTRGAISLAITLMAMAVAAILAHVQPVWLQADTAELLLLVSLGGSLAGLAISHHHGGSPAGTDIGGTLAQRPGDNS